MEMGKLTAKLRDAVPVCLLVEGKEIKQYKNIKIPDALKAMEYQDFKFDVPAHGAITFKIIFAPSVLPEEFPEARERRMRKLLAQGAEKQVPVATDVGEEAAPQEVQPAESIPDKTVEAPALALEDVRPAEGLVDAMAEAMADTKSSKAENIGDEAAGQEPVITAEPESSEAMAQPKSDAPPRKPAGKGKGKKDAATTESTDK